MIDCIESDEPTQEACHVRTSGPIHRRQPGADRGQQALQGRPVERVNQEEGPPEGVPSTGFRVYYDESQGTAVFVGYFASEEDMKAGSEILEQMDPSETPGTRASVDMCEVKVEVDA